MRLASIRELPERPSNFDIACRMLRGNLRQEPHCNFLWTNGRWQPASLDQIMVRANQLLRNAGRPQFTGKQQWVVQ